MTKFLTGILIQFISDPKGREFLLELAERMGKVLLPGLASVIPATGAAVAKIIGDRIPDFHLPSLTDLGKEVHAGVNAMLPEDVDIPFISDAFEKVTGFDLTDILTGRQK